MGKPFVLSEHIVDDMRANRLLGSIDKGYVIDFIKLLKKEMCRCKEGLKRDSGYCYACDTINKYAGSELI